jgi:hypothetical protein
MITPDRTKNQTGEKAIPLTKADFSDYNGGPYENEPMKPIYLDHNATTPLDPLLRIKGIQGNHP